MNTMHKFIWGRETLIALGLSIAVLLFSYLALALFIFEVSGKMRDLTVFFVAVFLLPPFCAAIVSKPPKDAAVNHTFHHLGHFHIWLATSIHFTLILLMPLKVTIQGSEEVWTNVISIVVAVVAIINIWGILSFRGIAPIPKKILQPFTNQKNCIYRNTTAVFWATLSILAFNFVWLSGDESSLEILVNDFLSVESILIATIIVIFSIILTLMEARKKFGVARNRVGLALAIFSIPILFFDYSLSAEALHYMTNISPALQLRHGGTLMVDTFSQYGPGPIFMTAMGFAIGPNTFGMANIVVQIHNLAFYSIWLACLYRMSYFKVSSIIIGLGCIAIFLATWGSGYGNINVAPSSLGFRYLPTILMVFSISILHPNKTNSFWTASATLISTLWSVEAFIGTVGIHITFIALIALHQRSWAKGFINIFQALLPILLAVTFMTLYTFWMAGNLPDYATYLSYLSVYNLASPSWSLPANSQFFGWVPILLIIVLVLTEVFSRLKHSISPMSSIDNTTLFYKFFPMALLCVLLATYFVGRSVPFTLVLAMLPFAALTISLLQLEFATTKQKKKYFELLFYITPLIAFILGLAFAVSALTRSNAPYTFVIQECRDHQRCSLSDLSSGLVAQIQERYVIDRAGNIFSDIYFDENGVIEETINIVHILGVADGNLTILLGPIRNINIISDTRDHIASDVALFYLDRWNRWPRSNTFADELLPERIQQILTEQVELRDGEIVIVRDDENLLGDIESGILTNIRQQSTLCPVPIPTVTVNVFRVSGNATCPLENLVR